MTYEPPPPPDDGPPPPPPPVAPPPPAPPPPAPFAAPPAPYGAPPGYPHAGPTTNGFAIAGMILGILGFVGCFAWILALVFGYIAKGQIDRSHGLQQGRGMAITAIVLGWCWFGLIVVYFAAFAISAAV